MFNYLSKNLGIPIHPIHVTDFSVILQCTTYSIVNFGIIRTTICKSPTWTRKMLGINKQQYIYLNHLRPFRQTVSKLFIIYRCYMPVSTIVLPEVRHCPSHQSTWMVGLRSNANNYNCRLRYHLLNLYKCILNG